MLPDTRTLAYTLLRFTFGLLLLTYGLNKVLIGPGTFAEGLGARFSESWLPEGLVLVFGHVLPFLEVSLGILIMAGLFNVLALSVAALMMMALVFGAVAEPNPPTVANNTLFTLVTFVLLWLSDYNHVSLDRSLRGPDTNTPPEEDISLTPRH